MHRDRLVREPEGNRWRACHLIHFEIRLTNGSHEDLASDFVAKMHIFKNLEVLNKQPKM